MRNTTNARKGLREDSRKSCATQSRKGFIFTLLVLMIIVFMIIEIGIYFRTYELRQESEPNKIRTQVISEVAGQFTKDKLTHVISIPVYTALYNLTTDAADPNKVPAYDSNLSALTNVTWALAWNGTRIDLNGLRRMPENSTLSFWDSRMKQTVASMGMGLETSYSGISLAQVDPWTMQLNVSVSFNLTDPVSTARISNAVVPISINTSIVGFEDPMIARKLGITKNIIPALAAPNVRLAASGDKGRGWFYGEPVTVLDASEVTYDYSNKKMIMVTQDISIAIRYANIYGAVVVVGPQPNVNFLEINVPIIFVGNLSISDPIFASPFLFVSDNDTAVTDTGASAYHRIYDMSALRSYAECGTYAAHKQFGYSFIARLTNSAILDPTGDMGIETTIGGLLSWVSNPSYSSVDHAYLSSATGTRVMGLPGCNDKVSCGITSGSPIPMKLDPAHASAYGVPDILKCSGLRCG